MCMIAKARPGRQRARPRAQTGRRQQHGAWGAQWPAEARDENAQEKTLASNGRSNGTERKEGNEDKETREAGRL